MNKNFKMQESKDNFVKVLWKLKNTVNRPLVWSETKGMPLLNDVNKPIGVLGDFTLDTSNNRFEMILIFTVWKEFSIDSFKDIEMVMLDNNKFEFKMI